MVWESNMGRWRTLATRWWTVKAHANCTWEIITSRRFHQRCSFLQRLAHPVAVSPKYDLDLKFSRRHLPKVGTRITVHSTTSICYNCKSPLEMDLDNHYYGNGINDIDTLPDIAIDKYIRRWTKASCTSGRERNTAFTKNTYNLFDRFSCRLELHRASCTLEVPS